MTKLCLAGCGTKVSAGSQPKRCRPCSNAYRRANRKPRVRNFPKFECEADGCAVMIEDHPRRKRRMCKACCARAIARDPARRAVCSAKMKAHLTDPAFAAELLNRIKSVHTDPEKRARRLERWHAMLEARWAWCPPAYRDLYRAIAAQADETAASARAVVLAQIDADARRVSAGGLVDQETFVRVREAAAWVRERAAA